MPEKNFQQAALKKIKQLYKRRLVRLTKTENYREHF